MKSILPQEAIEILKAISKDRLRTNLLKNFEQKTLVFLVQRIPPFIKPDMLTFIGFMGGLVILLSFILATYIHRNYLLLGVLGFAINWFGDSLDGRLAYYRQQPRKWYGFSLDLMVDWMSTISIGLGYLIYTEGLWELAGMGFVVMYGWSMIITLIRYKVTDHYSIDAGLVGPTEVRIIISAILVAEVFCKNSIHYSATAACAILIIINLFHTLNLLRMAAEKDRTER
ncbi:MAG: CDP-alcohol phosphatidyltransferase family protein [Bacteroidales bacterium]|nr:CDP-alcohol phosphatidyltransferase family protein [Bacteroidales bacterium]